MSAADSMNVTQFGGAGGNEYTAPNGKTYTMKHEGNFVSTARTASGRRAGAISAFGGSEPEEQTIHQIAVSGPHRGKGVATALMDYQRLQQPDLHHSSALTEDGKPFAAATPRTWQPKLDPDPQYTGSINDTNSMNWKEIGRQHITLKNARARENRQYEESPSAKYARESQSAAEATEAEKRQGKLF